MKAYRTIIGDDTFTTSMNEEDMAISGILAKQVYEMHQLLLKSSHPDAMIKYMVRLVIQPFPLDMKTKILSDVLMRLEYTHKEEQKWKEERKKLDK